LSEAAAEEEEQMEKVQEYLTSGKRARENPKTFVG
jgi:hypothetical protein